jgi:hypothetical protein
LKDLVTDLEATGEHVNQLFEDPNIPTLPISTSDVSYTKVDESTVSLSTYLIDLLNDIQATGEHIDNFF